MTARTPRCQNIQQKKTNESTHASIVATNLWKNSTQLSRTARQAYSDGITEEYINEALQMALNTREVKPSLILHSNRQRQYRPNSRAGFMERNGITRSMSRKGNSWDNVATESFYSRLKVELIYA